MASHCNFHFPLGLLNMSRFLVCNGPINLLNGLLKGTTIQLIKRWWAHKIHGPIKRTNLQLHFFLGIYVQFLSWPPPSQAVGWTSAPSPYNVFCFIPFQWTQCSRQVCSNFLLDILDCTLLLPDISVYTMTIYHCVKIHPEVGL